VKDKPVDCLEFQRLIYTEIGRHIDLFEKCRRRMIDLVCCALFPPTGNSFLPIEADTVDEWGRTTFGAAVYEVGLSDHFEQSIESLRLALDKLSADQIWRITVAVVSRFLHSEISVAGAISAATSRASGIGDPEVKEGAEDYREFIRDVLNNLHVVQARFKDCFEFRNIVVHGIWTFPSESGDSNHSEFSAQVGEIKFKRAQASDIDGNKAMPSDYIEVRENELDIERLQQQSLKTTALTSDILVLRSKIIQVWINRMSSI
jgi:hypothetical protein